MIWLRDSQYSPFSYFVSFLSTSFILLPLSEREKKTQVYNVILENGLCASDALVIVLGMYQHHASATCCKCSLVCILQHGWQSMYLSKLEIRLSDCDDISSFCESAYKKLYCCIFLLSCWSFFFQLLSTLSYNTFSPNSSPTLHPHSCIHKFSWCFPMIVTSQLSTLCCSCRSYNENVDCSKSSSTNLITAYA